MSRVLQVLEALGEDSCLMFILQHADSAMGLVFASWSVLADHKQGLFGYLSNFATGFQKVPFFLKIDQNQWFQNSRFHFYLVFI